MGTNRSRTLMVWESLKLSLLIAFFYVVGFLIRNLTKDPLAEFFEEMDRTGRLKIEDDASA